MSANEIFNPGICGSITDGNVGCPGRFKFGNETFGIDGRFGMPGIVGMLADGSCPIPGKEPRFKLPRLAFMLGMPAAARAGILNAAAGSGIPGKSNLNKSKIACGNSAVGTSPLSNGSADIPGISGIGIPGAE